MPSFSVAWPASMDLGEGAMWHAASERFFCVDIHCCTLFAWSPTTQQVQTWRMPERIGWIIARTDGDGFMVGLQSGFARVWLEPELRIERWSCPHPNATDVRLNDAKADCHGRIWAGSMNNRNPSQPDGQLVRLDADGKFEVLERNIHIANGPAIAADGSWMLHNDSYLNTTYRYSISEAGQLSDKTLWRSYSDAEGTPDGMTMDANGNVWIAFWGGACVRQFDQNGSQLQQIDLPALQITSMAFGSANFDTLFVTSARNGLNAEQLEKYPLSGCAFVVRANAKGLQACTFG